MDDAEKVVGLDELAGLERGADGQEDARDEVGRDVLEREAEREADDAGPGQQARHDAVEVEDPEGDERPGGEDGDVGERSQEVGDAPGRLDPIADPVEKAVDEALRPAREQGRHRHDDDRNEEVGETEDGRLDPPTELRHEGIEGVTDGEGLAGGGGRRLLLGHREKGWAGA